MHRSIFKAVKDFRDIAEHYEEAEALERMTEELHEAYARNSFDDFSAIYAEYCNCRMLYEIGFRIPEKYDHAEEDKEENKWGFTDEPEDVPDRIVGTDDDGDKRRFLSLLREGIWAIASEGLPINVDYKNKSEYASGIFERAADVRPDCHVANFYLFLLCMKKCYDTETRRADGVSDDKIRQRAVHYYRRLPKSYRDYALGRFTEIPDMKILRFDESSPYETLLPYLVFMTLEEERYRSLLNAYGEVAWFAYDDIDRSESLHTMLMEGGLLQSFKKSEWLFEKSEWFREKFEDVWIILYVQFQMELRRKGFFPQQFKESLADEYAHGWGSRSTSQSIEKFIAEMKRIESEIDNFMPPGGVYNLFASRRETLGLLFRVTVDSDEMGAGLFFGEMERRQAIDEKNMLLRDFSHTYGNMKASALHDIAEKLLNAGEAGLPPDELKTLGRKALLEYEIKQRLTESVYILRLSHDGNSEKLRGLIRESVAMSRNDDESDSDIVRLRAADIIDEALKLCLIRAFYDGGDRKAALARKSIKRGCENLAELAADFEKTVIAGNASSMGWFVGKGFSISLSVEGIWADFSFPAESYAAVLLRDLFSELLFNLLKYADLSQPAFVRLYAEEKAEEKEDRRLLYVETENVTSDWASEYEGEGLDAKRRLLAMLNNEDGSRDNETALTAGLSASGSYMIRAALAEDIFLPALATDLISEQEDGLPEPEDPMEGEGEGGSA